jgi:uncharacterized protein YdhG (YjbR/CyaY superfamily)
LEKDSRIKTVEDYIAGKPPDKAKMLRQIRKIVRSTCPEADEVINYRIPCYKHFGLVVGFGVQKSGCSFYTMNNKILSSFSAELKNIKFKGATIHFDPQEKLPVALLKKIIKFRIKENEERNWLKKMSNGK